MYIVHSVIALVAYFHTSKNKYIMNLKNILINASENFKLIEFFIN